MQTLLGIPRSRIPIAIAMVIGLAALLSWLQSRFDTTDVRKAIQLAMTHRPAPGGPTVFEAFTRLGEGDPGCDGEVVSQLLGDVRVICRTPGKPGETYEFRVLLDGKRPPRAANPAAERLLAGR